MKIALALMQCEKAQVARNLTGTIEFAERAAAAGVKVVPAKHLATDPRVAAAYSRRGPGRGRVGRGSLLPPSLRPSAEGTVFPPPLGES